jgi:hypothetical protein
VENGAAIDGKAHLRNMLPPARVTYGNKGFAGVDNVSPANLRETLAP